MNDLTRLIRFAESHGFTVRRTRGGHIVFRDQNGRRVATTGATPSDYRGHRNTIARLRRAGLPIPRKGERGNH